MREYQLRQDAITRYLNGENVSSISRALCRSRKWTHHWINRYKSDVGDSTWYMDLSKAPKTLPVKLESEVEEQILLIRRELEQEKMAQIGAISIQYEFERRNWKPIPAIWTINRVIAKHGLNKKEVSPKGVKEYPSLFGHTHQMDLVGPRYIKGDGKFYSINLIDTTTHSCFVQAARTKSSTNIVHAIASFWQTHGIPDALQMDNELAFRGSNRYPRSFGDVVRFALSQGVAPIFIPVREPWRNGMMEKFNDTYQKKFLQAYSFTSLKDLSDQEQSFIDFHNSHHRYSSQGHKTPNEMKEIELPPIYYKGIEHLPHLNNRTKIPLIKGSVYFIRYIRSDLKLYLPNEIFCLNPDLKYSYVVAEINIDNHALIIWQNDLIQQVFNYVIEAVKW